ncbi:hypothetical protein Dda_3401 [Drechslerella dactyloides]|uniref:Uncharacterized protein n=1 Tax=Drechslerella dactyloides TaxID=74499 RepID=A0AAD6J3K7_DREDA|nr:hypothetical protein Dda_3401 [Drechslerella dactyloides]
MASCEESDDLHGNQIVLLKVVLGLDAMTECIRRPLLVPHTDDDGWPSHVRSRALRRLCT